MVQSLLAGLGALIAYVFLFVTFGIRLLLPTPYLLKSIDVSDGVSYISNSPWGSGSDRGPLAIGLLLFAVAYFWTFRRLRRA
jgi:hypothetical protein